MQIIKTVDHLITVSHFLARDILSRYPTASGKINTLYTGEDPFRYIPHFSQEGQHIARQMKQELGIPFNYRIILFVGRLVEYKGCHHLIQAMKNVLEHFPDTALVIVGSKGFGNTEISEYIAELKTSAEKISNHIYFTNFIPVNQISNYYTMSDIFVCPSQWEEPLGRVLYEAMAAALPIVAANRGGIPEIISDGQNGFIIKHYDKPLAFAKSINKLLKDEKLMRHFGDINRDLVCKRYNFKNYAFSLAEIYSELARKKRNR
jgi:spore coat protein SA